MVNIPVPTGTVWLTPEYSISATPRIPVDRDTDTMCEPDGGATMCQVEVVQPRVVSVSCISYVNGVPLYEAAVTLPEALLTIA